MRKRIASRTGIPSTLRSGGYPAAGVKTSGSIAVARKAATLVEAEDLDVRDGSDQRHGLRSLGPRRVDRALDQGASHPALLETLVDGEALDLGDPGGGRLEQLEVSHDHPACIPGDENAPVVDVVVELSWRVVGELEERAQDVPRPLVPVERQAEVSARHAGESAGARPERIARAKTLPMASESVGPLARTSTPSRAAWIDTPSALRIRSRHPA